MIAEFFQETANGIEAALVEAGPGDLVARKKLALQSARLGARLYSQKEPVALCGVLAPFDLMSAFGYTSVFVEFVGATLAGTGTAGPFIDAAEQAGFNTDACTYHRAVIGAASLGQMPKPEVLVGTTCPCSGGLAVLEEMARRFEKPLFVIDIPYRKDERAIEDVEAQLGDLVVFIEEHTSARLDPERLRFAVERTNEMRAALVETYELAAAVPTPARRRDLINLAFVIALSHGTEEGVDIARSYRDELRFKVEHGIAGVPGEQARLLWFQNRIQFASPVEELLEKSYRAAVVVDELNDINWPAIDPERPFLGMARRMVSTPLAGAVDDRIAGLRRLIERYAVDGVINPCHWGCRQGTGARGLIADGLREIGVPSLSLEVDCIDERAFAEGQVRTRVDAFMELILERKAMRAQG